MGFKRIEYTGDLSFEDLIELDKKVQLDLKNTSFTDIDYNNIQVQENSKVYLVSGNNISKTKLKKLSKHYKFNVVNDPDIADILIFPSYASFKSKWSSSYYQIQQYYKDKQTGYISYYVNYDSFKYEKCIIVNQKFKNVSIDMITKVKNKIIMSDLYFANLHYHLENPTKDDVNDFNYDAVKELLSSSDINNVEIGLTILKNKNIECFLFNIILIYFLQRSIAAKLRIKTVLFDKIPFLKSLPTPANASLRTLYDLKNITDLLDKNNISYNLDEMLKEIKDAKLSNTISYKEFNGLNSYTKVYLIAEIINTVHNLKNIGVEITDDQIKQLLTINR
jgi:hypothetical protein